MPLPPLAELVAPIKKGSLGGAQVEDVGKICDSELKASDDDPSEGDNNGTKTAHSKFVYHRDRVVDKYSVTRDGEITTAARLSYNNSDQKSTSPNLYVETNAKAEADVVVLPTQAVLNSNEDEGNYAYLEPSVNYDSDGQEKCSRTTNNLFKPSELVAFHGKASTTLDSPFQATRAKGEYQPETILHANDYKTGPSPNGMTVELNDGFCFIASINEAAEYGTLLLNFQQYHPAEGGITSYMINNHIQDPKGLLVAPRTFKSVNGAVTTDSGYFDEDSINYQSMYKAKLSPVSLYSAPMWVYNKMVESRVVSYPHGHNDLQNNSDLKAYIAYIQSYSKNVGDKSADLNVSISNVFPFLATPFTDGTSIRTVVPFGENVTQSTADAARSDRTNEHQITAYASDSALHAGFSNSSYSNQVLWNADSVDGVTGQNTSDRKSVVGPTVSNVIRADLGWRPYEIIVFRGTLTYNKSTGVETHSEDYVEYFRFRTFDKVFEQGTYDRADNSYSKDAESTGTLNEDKDIHAYSFPVTGYHKESDGNFVINFSENFDTSNFSAQNKLRVAVIQDIVVDSSAVQATFTSNVINSILPSENRVFSPVYEDTLQVLSNDESLFSDTTRAFAGHPAVRPHAASAYRINGLYDGNVGAYVDSYWYFDPSYSNNQSDLFFTTLFTDQWYDDWSEPYGDSACFNAEQYIQAKKGGPSSWVPNVLTANEYDEEYFHTAIQGQEVGVGGIDLSALSTPEDPYYSTVPYYGDWPAGLDIPGGEATWPAPVYFSPDGGTTEFDSPASQRGCQIPIFPNQNITQMLPNGVDETKTAEDWGYDFSGGLAVLRNTSASFDYKNDTVYSDPACVAGYVNGYRESSWFARDLVAAYSATFFNQYKDGGFGPFHAEHNDTTLVMPPPWTLGIQLIKPENINGIDLDAVRCSPDRAAFHSKALGPEEGESDTLNGVGYHCGECEDLAEPPSAEFDDATKHGKVKKGFPLTDTLNDHRSYVRIHNGTNLNP